MSTECCGYTNVLFHGVDAILRDNVFEADDGIVCLLLNQVVHSLIRETLQTVLSLRT
jgi:hypothetical protein